MRRPAGKEEVKLRINTIPVGDFSSDGMKQRWWSKAKHSCQFISGHTHLYISGYIWLGIGETRNARWSLEGVEQGQDAV